MGGGSAAFAAAIKASELGARKIAMTEQGTVGGTCVNVGCIPSKYLLTVGELYYYGGQPRFDGVSLKQGRVNFKSVIEGKNRIVTSLRRVKYLDVLQKSIPGAVLFKGKASFRSSNEVQVSGKILRAPRFIVATGSSPEIPVLPGLEKVEYLTNVEALSPHRRPGSLIVVGGRALGLEFAQIYHHFGTEVTVLQRSPRVLPDEEPEIADALTEYLREEGLKIFTSVKLLRAERSGSDKTLVAKVSGRTRRFTGEAILMATGRTPNTSELALERAGVQVTSSGAILVNDELRTTSPHVWAAGDVIGKPMLETTAAKEGAIAAENALRGARRKIDLPTVPHAIFTSPQVASVGLTEQKTSEKFGACSCRILPMALVPKAVVGNDLRGLIKMVIEPSTRRIVGVHILSPMAADLIHEAVLAVKLGLTIDDIIDTVHVFPTYSEATKLVAQSFYKDVRALSCCSE